MSIQLNGSSQNLSTGAFSDLPSNATPVTFAIWANLDTLTPAQQVLIGVGTETSTTWSYIELMVLSSGAARLRLRNSGGTVRDATTANTITAGGWHHFCGVCASATDRRAYLDGDTANKGSNTTSDTISSTPNRLKIGKRPNSASNDWTDGAVAVAAYWKTALSESDIALLASGVHPLLVRPESLGEVWDLNAAGDIGQRLGRISLSEIGTPTTGASDPDILPAVAGASTVTGTLTEADTGLAGSVEAASTVSGTLTGTGALAGAVAASSTAAATLTGSGALSGAVAAVSGATGTLQALQTDFTPIPAGGGTWRRKRTLERAVRRDMERLWEGRPLEDPPVYDETDDIEVLLLVA